MAAKRFSDYELGERTTDSPIGKGGGGDVRGHKKGRKAMSKPVCELTKNSREAIRFSLGEFKGHRFCDMRIFITEPGKGDGKTKDPAPTKKGLAVSPALWPQFKAALAQVEAAMIQEGWLDREDLETGA